MAKKKPEVDVVEVIATSMGYFPPAPGDDDRLIEEGQKFLCPIEMLSSHWMKRVDGEEIPVRVVPMVSNAAPTSAVDSTQLAELKEAILFRDKVLEKQSAEIQELRASIESLQKKGSEADPDKKGK